MKSKKLEILIKTYEELSEEFGKFNDAQLESIIASWSVSLNQINEWLNDPDCSVKSSQIVSGFEQGLRELPSLLYELPAKIRPQSIRVLYQVVSCHLPEFYEKQKAHLEAIILKGKIKDENEWYLVRLRMDEIEGKPDCEKEFEFLDGILLAFEESV